MTAAPPRLTDEELDEIEKRASRAVSAQVNLGASAESALLVQMSETAHGMTAGETLRLVSDVRRLRALVRRTASGAKVAWRWDHVAGDLRCHFCGALYMNRGHAASCPWPDLEREASGT